MRQPYRQPVAAATLVAPRPIFNLAGTSPVSSIQALGFTLNLLFVFFVFSRMPELIALRTGLNIPVAMLLSALAAPTALISGNPQSIFRMRPVLLMVAFTGWIVVTAPFSQWRTGTLELFTTIWIKTILICVVVSIVIVNLEQVRKMMYALAYATLVVIGSALIWGGSMFGRLSVGEGSLSNPNEIASRLLTGFCFCLFVVWSEERVNLKKIIFIAAMPILLYLALKTGSRSGLLDLIALFCLLFLRATPGKKIMMVIGACLMIVLVLVILPEDVKSRYSTIFSSRQDMYNTATSTEDRMAIGSKEARTELVQEAMTMAILHPITGVGAGVYVEAAGGFAKTQGRRAFWHEAHNTYLQLAAELGVPGLLLYLSALVICVRRNFSIYRKASRHPELKSVANMSYCFFLAFVSWAIAALFDSRAYLMEFPIMLAMSSAFVLAAEPKVNDFLAKLPVAASPFPGLSPSVSR